MTRQYHKMNQADRDELRMLQQRLDWTDKRLRDISSDLAHVAGLYGEACKDMHRKVWGIFCREMTREREEEELRGKSAPRLTRPSKMFTTTERRCKENGGHKHSGEGREVSGPF